MAAGCITVPTYTTNTERDHQHILDNSGARAVIVSTAKLARPLMPAVMRSDAHIVITLDSLRAGQQGEVSVHDWAPLVSGGDASLQEIKAHRRGATPRDTPGLVYPTRPPPAP